VILLVLEETTRIKAELLSVWCDARDAFKLAEDEMAREQQTLAESSGLRARRLMRHSLAALRQAIKLSKQYNDSLRESRKHKNMPASRATLSAIEKMGLSHTKPYTSSQLKAQPQRESAINDERDVTPQVIENQDDTRSSVQVAPEQTIEMNSDQGKRAKQRKAKKHEELHYADEQTERVSGDS